VSESIDPTFALAPKYAARRLFTSAFCEFKMWPVSAFQSPPKYKEVANSDVDYKSDSEAGEGRIQRSEDSLALFD
jgi:hypothetical protein